MPNRANLLTVLVGLVTLSAVVAPTRAATVFAPNRHALRVKVDSFETSSFPVVEAVVTIDAPRKLDFRYLNRDHVGVIEEEVPVRDLKVVPYVPPLSIALVLDDSGSMEKDLRQLKESVDGFIGQLAERDEACLVSFHRGVQVLEPMTYSKPALQRALGTLRAYGATALYDGLLAGLQQLHRSDAKRTLVVVSDGTDQVYPGGRALSRLNVKDIVDLAVKTGVEIYAIGMGRKVDLDVMQTLAERTGGFFWHAPDPRYLKPLFDTMARSFSSRVKIFYESPNANFDRRDRTVVVDVTMAEYGGRGVGTYWLDRQAPSKTLQVQRVAVGDAGLAKLRLYTWTVNQRHLEIEFFLYDGRGNLVRHGFTTEDGFGRLERSHAPQLTDIEPGRYRLVLRREGTELDFDHPDVELEASRTLTLKLGFSQLVFRRDGKTWFDLRHDFGGTSDLIAVRVDDLAAGKQIYDGRLLDFETNRETAMWLQEGAYRVTLDNKWPVVPGKQRQAAVLKNALVAEFHVTGGSKLNFDTTMGDFLLPDDVLSREYLLAHAEESPFKAPTPLTRDEVATLAEQQARRYRKGTFDRFREHGAESDALYPYLGKGTMDGRVDELTQERVPRATQRLREARARGERFQVPYHNDELNRTFRDIHDRPIAPRTLPPPPVVDAAPGEESNEVEMPADVTTQEYLARQAGEIPTIDPRRPSRAELLRQKARRLRPVVVQPAEPETDDDDGETTFPRDEATQPGPSTGSRMPAADSRDARLDDLLRSVRSQLN